MAQSSSDTDNDYKGNGFFIKASSVGQGILLYNLALDIFFGKALIDRLNDDTAHDLTTIRQRLHPTATDGTGQWIDLAGLLTPKSAIDTLESTIVSHQGLSIHDISASLTALFESYTDMKWTWVVSQFRRRYGKEMSQLTPDDLQSIVSRYLEATKCIDRMIVDDAQKEYADTSMTGFGIDGDSTTRLQDFTAVHPPLDTTPFHLTLYSVHQEKALGLLSALQQLATGS